MSMNNSAASGYIVKALQLTSVLPSTLQERYKQLIQDKDVDELNELLGSNLPESFPDFEDVFAFSDEWESETLQCGEVYVQFCEESLFKPREETFAMQAIRMAGIVPELNNWVTWG